jgi:phosphocarrier protein FPr
VLDGLGGRPLVVRTLDVGGDKPLPYWPIAAGKTRSSACAACA